MDRIDDTLRIIETYTDTIGRLRRRQLDYDRASAHGLKRHEIDAMIRDQKGHCYICGEKRRRLDIDHNHKTGRVRKLLCTSCNTRLGYVEANESLLRKMVAYLDEHK